MLAAGININVLTLYEIDILIFIAVVLPDDSWGKFEIAVPEIVP